MNEQTRDEYELRRADKCGRWTIYQLVVHFDWRHFPNDEEGCPIIPRGAPLIEVSHCEVMATWPDDGNPDSPMTEYGADGTPCPTLEPPMTEQEIRDFDEYLADEAAGMADSRLDR